MFKTKCWRRTNAFCVWGSLVVLAVLGLLPFAVCAGTVDNSKRWALLVGIGTYANLPDLHGPINDIEILSFVLRTRYGFQNDHILTLRDKEATRTRIIQKIEELIARSTRSDVVYVHFSGHGSQVKDLNGDEVDDHKDETLVPYDGRGPNIPDITDDELNEFLNRIPGQRVIVSIDACHSGSATRGVNIYTRSVPPDRRLQLYDNNQRFTRGARLISSPHAVVFSSSAPNERALDGRIAGRYHGYFSYAIFRSLMIAPRDSDPQVIFEGVKNELHEIKNLLHRRTFPAPQLEVSPELKTAPLFPAQRNHVQSRNAAGQVLQARSSVSVKTLGDAMVELEAARYLGGLPSSVWQIIPTKGSSSVKSPEKILATVTAMKGMNAVARLSDGTGENLDHAYARLIQPAAPPSRLSIILRELHGALSNQSRKIQHMLRNLSAVPQLEHREGYVVDIRERDVAISSADGLERLQTLPLSDFHTLPVKLREFLTNSIHPVKLRTLTNPNSSILLKSRLLNVASDDPSHQTRLADPVLYIGKPHEPANEHNSLQLEVWVNKPSFLTIFDVDSNGTIRLLFPSPFQKQSYYPKGFLPGNERVVLPDSFLASNRAGFVWDIGAPKGQDTLYIIAATDEQMTKRIRQIVMHEPLDSMRPSRGGLATSYSSFERLHTLLYSHVPSGSRERGRASSGGRDEQTGSAESKLQGDWNAVTLNFWIEDSP